MKLCSLNVEWRKTNIFQWKIFLCKLIYGESISYSSSYIHFRAIIYCCVYQKSRNFDWKGFRKLFDENAENGKYFLFCIFSDKMKRNGFREKSITMKFNPIKNVMEMDPVSNQQSVFLFSIQKWTVLQC